VAVPAANPAEEEKEAISHRDLNRSFISKPAIQRSLSLEDRKKKSCFSQNYKFNVVKNSSNS